MAGSDETLLVFQHTYQYPNHSTISPMSKSTLDALMASRGDLTVHTTMPLERGATSVTVRQADLLTPPERVAYADMPNMRNIVATVRIPWRMRVGRSWEVLHCLSERAPKVAV